MQERGSVIVQERVSVIQRKGEGQLYRGKERVSIGARKRASDTEQAKVSNSCCLAWSG